MDESRKVFSLYPRKRKNLKSVFYVRFRNHDGSWTAGKLTGKCTRSAAETWAIDYLRSGQVVEREMITVREFSRAFFDWNGDWATDKKLSLGRISERVCFENQATLENRILPFLGDRRLTSLDRNVIKEFRRELFKLGYAPRTINKTLSCLKMILEYAEERRLIQGIPKIERAAGVGKSRGILTTEEVRELFERGDFKDFRARIANLTAALTGLRAGELLGLLRKDVKPGRLEITKSWNQELRKMNATTKNGRSREIPIPAFLQRELDGLLAIASWTEPGDFVFFSTLRRVSMDGIVARRGLYEALASIGVGDEERKARWIDFHSWRHWLNSVLINRRVPLNKVMAVTGHLTPAMAENYYHPDDFGDVRLIQENLLASPASTG